MFSEARRHAVSFAATEARFRVQSPNAAARDILFIPLDEMVAHLVEDMSRQPWKNARFVPFSGSGEAWRVELEQRLVDLVVVVGQAGEDLSQANLIGKICIDRQIKTSGVLLRNDGVSPTQMAASLRSMRPWMRTLTVITEVDDMPGLLHALGA
jgi:hypothetical protein